MLRLNLMGWWRPTVLTLSCARASFCAHATAHSCATLTAAWLRRTSIRRRSSRCRPLCRRGRPWLLQVRALATAAAPRAAASVDVTVVCSASRRTIGSGGRQSGVGSNYRRERYARPAPPPLHCWFDFFRRAGTNMMILSLNKSPESGFLSGLICLNMLDKDIPTSALLCATRHSLFVSHNMGMTYRFELKQVRARFL